LTDKPLLGVVAFGIAITIKAQAIFIAPLLAILFFKRRIAWQYFLMVPLIYILLD
jgi:Gpi18-like mannosyltransferase